ncbi:hypothetical protein SAMN04489740_3625 [Arthrobacter alpinus]|uniref:Ribosomal protein L7/L12 C-terminal domain-containing protein n=1 Tax=Arthrobacter alpinus TaxID=656366 RepID=A0A1H5NDT2_9MICC|nr:hypothetical protein [Arthrobacter alpinus]SEE99799.1 hypothetical protein SAMN04489740_3625 [Arthrobacter alpinus]
MEYVVPLIIVLVIVIAVVVGSKVLKRRSRPVQESGLGADGLGHKQAKGNREISRENAEAASARLNPVTHQRVYSMIAQRQVLNAVKEYRSATGMSLGDSAAAVAALAQFPQPTPEAKPAPVIKEGPLTVDDIIKAAPEEVKPEPAVRNTVPSAYRYRAIVSQGGDVREVASTRLNEQIFRQIRDLAQSGNYDGAARLLRSHADIGEGEAREFVSMIGPED